MSPTPREGRRQKGIHLGAMAGTVDAVLRIFTGIETRENVLWLNPLLPEDLKELRLRLHYRNNELRLRIRRDQIDIESTDLSRAADHDRLSRKDLRAQTGLVALHQAPAALAFW